MYKNQKNTISKMLLTGSAVLALSIAAGLSACGEDAADAAIDGLVAQHDAGQAVGGFPCDENPDGPMVACDFGPDDAAALKATESLLNDKIKADAALAPPVNYVAAFCAGGTVTQDAAHFQRLTDDTKIRVRCGQPSAKGGPGSIRGLMRAVKKVAVAAVAFIVRSATLAMG